MALLQEEFLLGELQCDVVQHEVDQRGNVEGERDRDSHMNELVVGVNLARQQKECFEEFLTKMVKGNIK